MKSTKASKFGSLFGAALLGALTACVGHSHSQHGGIYAQPPDAYVESGALVPDDYVYYPYYETYYSSHRHQYVYRDGHSWV